MRNLLRFLAVLALLYGVAFYSPFSAIVLAAIGADEHAMPARDADAPPGRFGREDSGWLFVPYTGSDYVAPPLDALGARKLRFFWQMRPRSADIYLPGQHEGPRPAIILFHGAGRAGASMIDMWKATAERHGLVLIALNSARVTWNLDLADAGIILELLDRVDRLMPLDDRQLFLFGHSDGAAYAQLLVNHRVGPWRAAALHAGFNHIERIHPAADAKPIRLYVGTAEQIFPPEQAEKVGRALAGAGHDFQLQVITGHSHWFYDIGPAIAEDSWTWFQQLG